MALEFRDERGSRYQGCWPLLIEDDPEYLCSLERAFVQAGVPAERLRTARDGEEAISMLRTADPDALLREGLPPSFVVLDLSLPKMHGLEVLSWIRQAPKLRDLSVFMLSTSDRGDHVSRAFELRADSFFVKPASREELQIVVDGMLAYWHARHHRRLPRS